MVGESCGFGLVDDYVVADSPKMHTVISGARESGLTWWILMISLSPDGSSPVVGALEQLYRSLCGKLLGWPGRYLRRAEVDLHLTRRCHLRMEEDLSSPSRIVEEIIVSCFHV